MDNKQLNKLISCFSMADGGLYYATSGSSNAYFAMNMLTKHMDYIDYVKSTLENIVYVAKSEVKNPCKNPQTRITSRIHPLLSKIHSRIYRDGGYKGLDEHWVHCIDFEILAIFYMADGSLSVEKPNIKKGLVNHSPNVTLNMKRLSYGDQWFLKKCLKDNLDLEFNIMTQKYNGKVYYYLRLRNKDVSKFMDGIKPYILKSFEYKLFNSGRIAPDVKLDDDIV
jgi:hypothetical protein